MTDPRRGLRSIGHKINFLGTTYLVLQDGKITTEDGKEIAIGVLNSLLIANEASIVNFANARGYTATASKAVSAVGLTYLAGVGASYLIDPEDGVENFHTFLNMVYDDPIQAATVTVYNLGLLGQHVYDTARPHIDQGIENTKTILKDVEKFVESQEEKIFFLLPDPISF